VHRQAEFRLGGALNTGGWRTPKNVRQLRCGNGLDGTALARFDEDATWGVILEGETSIPTERAAPMRRGSGRKERAALGGFSVCKQLCSNP